ncbi:MAG TPA: DNA primase [Candidatus Paceibacterota bacterium]|nr:DNA primase [Candidatus Paceibacterota bacterium]
MNSSVQTIKERLSIVDVISSYLSVEKAGKNYKAKCPFHNEKTPSFFISEERGSYYCFGCGAKGDIFSFVEHFEGTDFLGSLKILAERAGVELSSYKNKEKDKKDTYYEIMEEATSFFENNFFNNKEARSYILSRGINDASIKLFRIGYSLESWTSLFDYLIKKGFKKEDIETVGLIKKKDDRFYDRFRGRIMFPINDSSGRVIAFTGRIFKKPDANSSIEEAKYLNSPDTPLFNKSNVLFGLDKAKNAIRTRDYSIIVEGQVDLILSHQAGFTNTVAVSGTAFTDTLTDNESKINNLGLVRRLSSNIIFAYDGDDAGIRAVNRSAMIALSLGMQVKVAVFPKGKDPADIILEDRKKWEEIIKSKTDIISFHLDKICENTKDKEGRRRQIIEKIFPFLAMIESSIKKSNYIKEIYDKTGISESAITDDYKEYEKSQNINNISVLNKQENTKNTNSRRDNLEKRLFGIIFWKGENEEQANKIEELRISFENNIGADKYKKLFDLYNPRSDDLSFEAEMWYGDKIKTLTNDMKEIVLNLEEEILNEELYSILLRIKDKERKGEKDDIDKELTTYQKIVEKIEDIKHSRSK